jgi:hypothetical protein
MIFTKCLPKKFVNYKNYITILVFSYKINLKYVILLNKPLNYLVYSLQKLGKQWL